MPMGYKKFRGKLGYGARKKSETDGAASLPFLTMCCRTIRDANSSAPVSPTAPRFEGRDSPSGTHGVKIGVPQSTDSPARGASASQKLRSRSDLRSTNRKSA